MDRKGTKYGQNMNQVRTKLNRKWKEIAWIENGQKIHKKQIENRQKMDQKWTDIGPKMDFFVGLLGVTCLSSDKTKCRWGICSCQNISM